MNYRELYKSYSKKFDQMNEYALEHHEKLFDDQKMSREVFRTVFAQKKEQIEVTLGRKVDNKDVIKELVDQHKYSGTLAQAANLRKALKRRGYEMSWRDARKYGGQDLSEIKNGAVQNFWNDIQQERRAYILRNPNATPAQISHFIAVTFFGSPD